MFIFFFKFMFGLIEKVIGPFFFPRQCVDLFSISFAEMCQPFFLTTLQWSANHLFLAIPPQSHTC